jgi:hypothetical protein
MKRLRTSTVCKKLSVCIIDNDPASLKQHTQLVKNLGCESYITIPVIYDALNDYHEFFKGRIPDLIISEWYPDYAHNYFMESKLKDVPLIIVTAPERTSIRNGILEKHKNIKAFLDKPIDLEILRILLRKLFRRQHIVY